MFSEHNITGADVIIFGSGPSLLEWNDTGREDSIRCTCNSVIFSNIVKQVDYYFIQDTGCKTSSRRTEEGNGYCAKKIQYDEFTPNIKKFYGIGVNGQKKKWSLSLKDVVDGGAESYYLYTGPIDSPKKIAKMESVVFTMVQFVVKNGCRSVKFVGCDGTKGERFNEARLQPSESDIKTLAIWNRQWQLIYKFLDNHHVHWCR